MIITAIVEAVETLSYGLSILLGCLVGAGLIVHTIGFIKADREGKKRSYRPYTPLTEEEYEAYLKSKKTYSTSSNNTVGRNDYSWNTDNSNTVYIPVVYSSFADSCSDSGHSSSSNCD